LCALGATLSVVTALNELRYHIIPSMRGPAYALAALCIGVVLGLWIPRRVIRRRLAGGRSASSTTPATDLAASGGLSLEFAASLAGALVLTCALASLALCAGALLMEDYRAFLVRRFAHPPWLTQLLLAGPILTGLVVSGAIGTTLLVALHGWYRLVTQPKTHIARLWAYILLGTLLAGLLATQINSRVLLAGLAPLAVFLAGAVAVLRRCDAVGMPTPPRTRQRATRDESLSLMIAGLAAALVAAALVLAVPPAGVAPDRLPVGVIGLAGAAGAGLLAARLISRLSFSVDLEPLILLLASVALLFPYRQVWAEPVNVALPRLLLVTGWAATCIVMIGRRVERVHRSIQYSLLRVGRAVAAGLGLTLLLLAIGTVRWNPSLGALVVSLVATTGAGLALALNDRVSPMLRVGGMSCMALWLVGALPAHRALARTLPPPASPARPVTEPLAATTRQLLTTDFFQAARVLPLPSVTAGATGWQFDLAGPTLDLIVLESAPAAERETSSGSDWGRRLLGRLGTRLARGGRLLVELPVPAGLADALGRFDPTPDHPGWTGYRVRVWSDEGQYEALVFGHDIPALLERNRRQPELHVELQPIHAASEIER
jgi:hypothetical protein